MCHPPFKTLVAHPAFCFRRDGIVNKAVKQHAGTQGQLLPTRGGQRFPSTNAVAQGLDKGLVSGCIASKAKRAQERLTRYLPAP